jgi:hypothetical protein
MEIGSATAPCGVAFISTQGGDGNRGPKSSWPCASGQPQPSSPSSYKHHYATLGRILSADDFTDTEALAAVARITGGKLRLVRRLFAQARRIMEIN